MRAQQNCVGLWVIDEADTLDEDVSVATKRGPAHTVSFFRGEPGALGGLKLLLSVSDTFKIVITINSISRDSDMILRGSEADEGDDSSPVAERRGLKTCPRACFRIRMVSVAQILNQWLRAVPNV